MWSHLGIVWGEAQDSIDCGKWHVLRKGKKRGGEECYQIYQTCATRLILLMREGPGGPQTSVGFGRFRTQDWGITNQYCRVLGEHDDLWKRYFRML